MDEFFLLTRFLVSSDLKGAFSRSRRDGALSVVEPASHSDSLDPLVALVLVPGSNDDTILKHVAEVTTPTGNLREIMLVLYQFMLALCLLPRTLIVLDFMLA